MDFANCEILFQCLRLICSGAKPGRRLIAAEIQGLGWSAVRDERTPSFGAKAISRSHTTKISHLAKSISGQLPGHEIFENVLETAKCAKDRAHDVWSATL